ncbi:hypothetical protein BH23ACT11_BH23ACT11_18420 [soil metagenome]
MKTVSISDAVIVLRSGGVVLVPTETVAGLLASEQSLNRLSELKLRHPQKPVALLCASANEAFELALEVPAIARTLADRYWPGPLTMVLSKLGGGTVGLRVPDHEGVRELLVAYGGPLYATSANLAGQMAPAALEDVDPGVVRKVDAIVSGDSGRGEASAVVDLSGVEPRLLRPNESLTAEKLRRLVQEHGQESV